MRQAFAGAQALSRGGGFDRETHHDVGAGQLAAGEPGAAGQLGFHQVELALDLRREVGGLDGLADHAPDRADQHGHALGHLGEQKGHDQGGHGGALGEVEPVGVALPVLGADGRDHAAAAVLAENVFDDGAGFGDRLALIGDDRRLAQRVDGEQLGRGGHGLGVPLVALDLVRQAELLQQPQDALRTGIVEMMDGQHRRGPKAVDGSGGGAPWDVEQSARV